jgi:hypothetical protein
MSIFHDKTLKSVAAAAAKIMEASAKKADKDYDQDGKVESPKAEVLGSRIRAAKMAGKMKEETELDEASYSAKAARAGKDIGKPGKQFSKIAKSAAERYGSEEKGKKVAGAILAKLRKEDVEETGEQLLEYESKGGVFKHQAKLAKGAKYGESDYSKGGEEEKEHKKAEKEEAKKEKKLRGPRQNMGLRGLSDGTKKKKVNEELSFTEMLELYNEHGIKVLAPIETEEMDVDGTTIEVIDGDKINGVVATTVEEEATEEEFNKELKDQQDSFAGKKKQPPVVAGKTTGVKQMPEEVELDERTLTSDETKKKEHYVKSMKKSLSGFKQRYGERAKSVMYATATKMAKKD